MVNRLYLLIGISIASLLVDVYLSNAVRTLRPSWSGRYRTLFTAAWWGTSAALVIAVGVAFFMNLRLGARSISLVAFFITFVAKIALTIFVLLDDIRRAVIYLKRNRSLKKEKESATALPGEKIPRSKFLLQAGVLAAGVPFASLGYGVISGVYDYRVRRKTLVLPNLPQEFDGIRLGQISDIHSGSFYNRKAVLGGVEMLLAEKPDLVFFTGDLVNFVAREMRDYQDIFTKVKAPLGVFSTLGNHDYGDYHYGFGPTPDKAQNLRDLKTTHKNMGWQLLMNEHRRLKVDGREIGILGVENWSANGFVRHGRMDLATKHTGDLPVKLLLSHDPSHWRAQVLEQYPDIDVMFSGHTHGMQLGVRTEHFQWSPVKYIYNEWAGLYRERHQQLYVNVGYGFLGYPGRVGILPEITIFELKRS
ncbi:metallophosphoesterase [Hufsiella ginkgonis]|uniref:Metallophosphoesterase n=1 Tax=Hufsiella ginkgonis TaxID=2695274 RepID=A0A7K1Y3C1_9SPHI|nr:metallophosphoesterase [Hufsiella ginkgonis]MXV17608.1 metallophosphoesterase [Hufsiella ginkgonis]